MFGAIMIRSVFLARRSRTLGLLMLIVVGAGGIRVGLFPWDAVGPAHYLSALVTFVFGNLAQIVLGVSMRRATVLNGYRVFSLVGGMVGLVALVLDLFSSAATTGQRQASEAWSASPSPRSSSGSS